MSTNSQREEIKDVQAECELHWLANRVPQDRAEEMADELGQHLEEALQNGKTVEDAVSPNTAAFAESLADQERPVWTAKDRVVEYFWALSFQAAFFAACFHLLTWSLFLPTNWQLIPYLLAFSWPLSRLVLKPEPSDTHSKRRRWVWLAAAVLLVVVALLTRDAVRPILEDIDVAITGNADGTLFVWPWYGTFVVVAACFVLGKLRKGV